MDYCGSDKVIITTILYHIVKIFTALLKGTLLDGLLWFYRHLRAVSLKDRCLWLPVMHAHAKIPMLVVAKPAERAHGAAQHRAKCRQTRLVRGLRRSRDGCIQHKPCFVKIPSIASKKGGAGGTSGAMKTIILLSML